MRMYPWEEGIQASLLYLNNWNFETNTPFKNFFHSLASKFIENPPVQNGVIQSQRIQGKMKCSNFGPYFLWFYMLLLFFFSFLFSSPPLREKEDIKTVLSGSLLPLGDHRYREGLCFLEWEGSFLPCSLSYRRWWKLIHSTRFCPIAWYRSQDHTPVGPRRSCTWESSPAPGLLRVLWRERRFRGDQPEDDSGEWTSTATNLELYETSQCSNAFALVFCIAQAKWNTSVGQIQSMSSQCAGSDGWALLFAFRISSFIRSLKDLF